MSIVKKYDFVEIEYTARIKEDNTIFDTTDEKIAKKNELYDKDADYSPVVICIGENQILKGLEDQIVGKDIGKEYEFEVSSENAFGKKDAKLIQLVGTNKFRQQNIQPVPGLRLNIDGVLATVKTVSGGRCLVDFNHPLAGKDLIYQVKINKVVDDDKEKLKSLIKTILHIKDTEVEVNDGIANTTLRQKISKETEEELQNAAQRLIPSIKKISFTIKEEKK